MRLRHAVDKSQAGIVAALRQAGATVQDLSAVGRGCPDLVVGVPSRLTGQRVNYMIECKTGRGRLTEVEKMWLTEWNGQVAVCYSPDDALRLIGAI